jgi:hypothetical protein
VLLGATGWVELRQSLLFSSTLWIECSPKEQVFISSMLCLNICSNYLILS